MAASTLPIGGTRNPSAQPAPGQVKKRRKSEESDRYTSGSRKVCNSLQTNDGDPE